VEAGSNPVGFFLIGGEAHDEVGAGHLTAEGQANMLTADTAFDADERMLEPPAAAGKTEIVTRKDISRRCHDIARSDLWWHHERVISAARHSRMSVGAAERGGNGMACCKTRRALGGGGPMRGGAG